MSRRRWVIPVVLAVGLAMIMPSASAQPREFEAKELPRPTRTFGVAGQDAKQATSILVKFRQTATKTRRDRALTRRNATALGPVGNTGYTKVRPKGDPADLVAALNADPAVDVATLDYPRLASVIPNDPGWSQAPQSQYLTTVRLPQAWDRIRDASRQIVAVIDTGVDSTHPDLAGRLVAGYNVVNPATPPTDSDGHGTMVAGIVAANTNNGDGVVGAAWNGRVMPIKVFAGEEAFDSDIAVGIRIATDRGANIINLSLGGPGESPILHEAITYATSRNVVVIAASGNTGDNVAQFPAAYPEVLAVGATDEAGALTDFSSYGDWLDVAAPGFNIVSTGPGSSYWIGHGTSFAAPLVAGIAALVRSAYPGLTAAQVGDRLRNSARDAGPRGHDPYYGSGVVDAAYAVGGTFAADFPLTAGTGEPNDVPARATPLVNGAASGALAAAGDSDWYRYEETQTRGVTISITAPAAYDPDFPRNIDPVVEVYNASMRQLAAVDNNLPGDGESVGLSAQPGTYFIKVRNYNGATDTRPYVVTVATGQPTLFTPPRQISMDVDASTIAIGDVTGDGRNDLVFGTGNGYFSPPELPHRLFVSAQLPNGDLDTPVSYQPTQPSGMSSFALADINRDGLKDVVIAGTNGIEIFRQSSGVLVSDGLLPGVTGKVNLVLGADMDTDADDDLVIHRTSGITLLTHGGGSTFTSSVVHATDTALELEAGDLDGDGRLDVAAIYGSLPIRVYHNTVSGWTRTEHIVTGGIRLGGLEVADVTGDGQADVIATKTANAPAGSLYVFRQTNSSLADPVAHPAGELPEAMEAGDVDGDGRNDVVAANSGWHSISVLRQRSDGTLGTREPTEVHVAQHMNTQGIAVGDLDSDGRLDVAVSADLHWISGGVILLRSASSSNPGASFQEFVRTVTPSDSSTGLALSTTPQVGFQVDLNPVSVTNSTVRLLDGRTGGAVPAALSYDAPNKTVTLTPTSPLHDNKPYRIVVDGVTDTTGNPQPWPFTSTFRTQNTTPAALGYTITGGVGAVDLTFAPPMGDLDQIIIRAAVGTTPPTSTTSGLALYAGIDSSVTIRGLTEGSTYSFALWAKDRGGQFSPRQTATLIGSTLSMVATSSTTTTTTSPITLGAHLTRADTAGPWTGQPVKLIATCRGVAANIVRATETTNATGDVSVTLTQTTRQCTYHWQLTGLPTFMGTASDPITYIASIVATPGTPRTR